MAYLVAPSGTTLVEMINSAKRFKVKVMATNYADEQTDLLNVDHVVVEIQTVYISDRWPNKEEQYD